MKTKHKLKQAFEALQNLNADFDTYEEGVKALSEAVQAANHIIDLQKLRIQELEEENASLYNRMDNLEEQIQILLENR